MTTRKMIIALSTTYSNREKVIVFIGLSVPLFKNYQSNNTTLQI